MNIYEELRKKRPLHPVMGTSSTLTTEQNENIQPNHQQQYTSSNPTPPPSSSSNTTTTIPSTINNLSTTATVIPVSFVTGPPSKNHWKSDSEVSFCSGCGKAFNIINRRHHCRKCGDIFCSQCANYTTRLDQDCRFNPKGIKSRVCKLCFEEYQSKIISLVKNSEPLRYKPRKKDRNINRDVNSFYNPEVENITISKPPPGPDLPQATLMSVPNDWSWSTF